MEIRAVDGYRLYVRFEDGRAGKIDLGGDHQIQEGIRAGGNGISSRVSNLQGKGVDGFAS